MKAIITKKDVIIFFEDGDVYTIPATSPYFERAVAGIREDDEEAVRTAIDLEKALKEYSSGAFKIIGGKILVDGEEADELISSKIIEFYRRNLDYVPLLNFIRRLRKNPSKQSVEHLYECLRVNHHPILPDGRFLGYKSIRENWNDWHTNTVSNKVGQKPFMERRKVDDNRDRACSTGYHVASYQYARDFHSWSGRRIVLVAVDPADVVSVPADSNNQKVRVCRYEVLAEIEPAEILSHLLGEEELKKLGVKGAVLSPKLNYCSHCKALSEEELTCDCDEEVDEERVFLCESCGTEHKEEELVFSTLGFVLCEDCEESESHNNWEKEFSCDSCGEDVLYRHLTYDEDSYAKLCSNCLN